MPKGNSEGEKAIKIKLSLSLPQSFFFEKRQLPRQREPEYAVVREYDFICNFLRTGASPRRRLHRIVRNSLWLPLTHYATPPFPQKSRSVCLFGCKRPHNGSLSLPTFADFV